MSIFDAYRTQRPDPEPKVDQPARYADGKIAKGHVRIPAWLLATVDQVIPGADGRTIGPSHVLVYLVVKSWWSPKKNPFPSVKAICARAGLGPTQVRELLRDLEAVGVIRRHRRTDGHRQTSNSYELAGDDGPLATICGPDEEGGVRSAGDTPSGTPDPPPSGATDPPPLGQPVTMNKIHSGTRSTQGQSPRTRSPDVDTFGAGVVLGLDEAERILANQVRRSFQRISDTRLRDTIGAVRQQGSDYEDLNDREVALAIMAVASRLRHRRHLVARGVSDELTSPNALVGFMSLVLRRHEQDGTFEGAESLDFGHPGDLAFFVDELAEEADLEGVVG